MVHFSGSLSLSHTHTRTNTYIYTHTHKHVYTHTHTHTQVDCVLTTGEVKDMIIEHKVNMTVVSETPLDRFVCVCVCVYVCV